MKYHIFFLAVLLGTIHAGFDPAGWQQAGSAVAIRGHVVGVNGLQVVTASIEFVKEGEKLSTVTTYRGAYLVEVHPGKYSVKVVAPGFCPRSQELLLGAEDKAISLDFTLMDCSDCDPRNIDFDSSIEPEGRPAQLPLVDTSKTKYQRKTLEGLRLNKPPPDILFGHRQETGDLVVYGSLSCLGWPQRKPAIFMYGPITLSAATLTYSTKSHTLRAEGDVVVVDEQGAKRTAIADLAIENGEFRVSIAK